MGTCVIEKIEVAKVVLDRAEGLLAKASVSDMKAANDQLRRWALICPPLNYDKVDFTVLFEDGMKYLGCFELTAKDSDLAQHIRSHLKFLVGSGKPSGWSTEQYARAREKYSASEIRTAHDLLRDYVI